LGRCRSIGVDYDLNRFAISFMENLSLLKKEKMALSLFLDQMELSAGFNMREIFLTTCTII